MLTELVNSYVTMKRHAGAVDRAPAKPGSASAIRCQQRSTACSVNRALLSDQTTSMPSMSGSLPPTWMLKCLRLSHKELECMRALTLSVASQHVKPEPASACVVSFGATTRLKWKA